MFGTCKIPTDIYGFNFWGDSPSVNNRKWVSNIFWLTEGSNI